MRNKLGTFLSEEIRWGRLAWMALAAAALAMLASTSDVGILSALPLLVFSVGGILVASVAPRHPYVNSLYFGLVGLFFGLVLHALSILGTENRWITTPEVLGALIFLVTFVPQSLLGTWIGVTMRRFREMSQRRAQPPSEQKPGSPASKGTGSRAKSERSDSGGRKKGGRKKR